MPLLFSTATMSLERIPLDKFLENFSDTTGTLFHLQDFVELVTEALCSELSSVALGAKIISVSDEFFAEAYHLLLVEVC